MSETVDAANGLPPVGTWTESPTGFSGNDRLPFKVSTLLFGFNEQDEVLLLERAREPNRGCWSPFGGKLEFDIGESPFECAAREAQEEAGLQLDVTDLHLTGIVSEQGYLGQAHWLMFLFEIRPRIPQVPPPHEEGRFAFHSRSTLQALSLPASDARVLWPLFWAHRGGFFSVRCLCRPEGTMVWRLEDSRPAIHHG